MRLGRWLGSHHAEATNRRVDGVAGHEPIRRELAAADPDEPVRLDDDPMLARCGDRGTGALDLGDERPHARVYADDVVALEIDVERAVDRADQLADLVRGGDRAIDRAFVWRVRRPDEPVTRPRNQEDGLAGNADREADGARNAIATDEEMGTTTRQHAVGDARNRT